MTPDQSSEARPGTLEIWRELDPLVKRLFVGVVMSAVGSGLTMPFLYKYLTGPRHIDGAVVGWIMAYMGLLGFCLGPLAGSLIDRFGPRPIMLVGLVVEMSGVFMLGFVQSVSQIVLVASWVVMGTIGLWPAATAMMTRLIREEHRETVYGLQFMIMNAGLGVGGMLSSVLLPSETVGNFQRLYVVNAAAYLAYIVVVASLPRGTGGRPRESTLGAPASEEGGPAGDGAVTAESGGWAEVVRDRAAMRVVGVSVLVLVFGYAQFEIGFPAYATDIAGVPTNRLGWAFGANTAAIVVGQVLALKLIAGRRRSAMLALCALVWCLAWSIIASSALFPGTGALVAVIVGLGVFGIGETLWAPVAPAIINGLAPEGLRGRYNALQGMTWTVSTIVGPALAGMLMGNHMHRVWVGLTVGGTAVGSLLLLSLRRHLTPAQDGLAQGATPTGVPR